MELQNKAGSILDIKDSLIMQSLAKTQEATGKAHVVLQGGTPITSNINVSQIAASLLAKQEQQKKDKGKAQVNKR